MKYEKGSLSERKGEEELLENKTKKTGEKGSIHKARLSNAHKIYSNGKGLGKKTIIPEIDDLMKVNGKSGNRISQTQTNSGSGGINLSSFNSNIEIGKQKTSAQYTPLTPGFNKKKDYIGSGKPYGGFLPTKQIKSNSNSGSPIKSRGNVNSHAHYSLSVLQKKCNPENKIFSVNEEEYSDLEKPKIGTFNDDSKKKKEYQNDKSEKFENLERLIKFTSSKEPLITKSADKQARKPSKLWEVLKESDSTIFTNPQNTSTANKLPTTEPTPTQENQFPTSKTSLPKQLHAHETPKPHTDPPHPKHKSSQKPKLPTAEFSNPKKPSLNPNTNTSTNANSSVPPLIPHNILSTTAPRATTSIGNRVLSTDNPPYTTHNHTPLLNHTLSNQINPPHANHANHAATPLPPPPPPASSNNNPTNIGLALIGPVTAPLANTTSTSNNHEYVFKYTGKKKVYGRFKSNQRNFNHQTQHTHFTQNPYHQNQHNSAHPPNYGHSAHAGHAGHAGHTGHPGHFHNQSFNLNVYSNKNSAFPFDREKERGKGRYQTSHNIFHSANFHKK